MEKKFHKAAVRPDFKALDRKWQTIWKEKKLFDVTNEIRDDAEPWVFFDGPPGTNGVPHIGHMMQSALKDVWPRFWTMRGRKVIRRAGWDTHGLPVELTAEKELGIKTKRGIEEFGVQKYIDYCRDTVFRYKSKWEQAILRIGREISLDDAYATYREPYIETDWWFLQRAWRTQISENGDLHYGDDVKDGYRRLLYRNYRIMPYCCRCGTTLSNFEIAQGYKTVSDMTLYAKFPLREEPSTFFVAWTTTAWTLLSNVALAVGPEIEYIRITFNSIPEIEGIKKGETIIVAKERKEEILKLVGQLINEYERKHPEIYGQPPKMTGEGKSAHILSYSESEPFLGKLLLGTRYIPLWEDWQLSDNDNDYKVVVDNFVTTDDGSGIVHLAAYGEDDFRLIQQNDLTVVQNVDENGNVIEAVPVYGKRFFKAKNDKGDTLLDLDILKDLHGRGLLFAKEKHEHEYPFCYRCDTPLMYFARAGWFFRMTDLKSRLLAGNQSINWQPEHIRDGRFGNWLENVIDWNFTRERYWGSPLPIWTNRKEGSEYREYCIGSHQELEKLALDPIPKGFDLHKPVIDEIRIKHPETGETLFRENFVLDSWFDAGMMPWGQWGYPYAPNSIERMDGRDKQYPADFICEAIDQTRGWFYTLLACSVIHRTIEEARGVAPDKLPPLSSFKNVICTELIMDDKGQKMSKSKGNVVDPVTLFDKYGADPVRWLFYASNPWNVKRYSDAAIEEGIQMVLGPVWNAYVFFSTYAEADNWVPSNEIVELTSLDKWIRSRLRWLIETVTVSLEEFDIAKAAQAFTQFFDELNNWYIRRSRRRFWKSESDSDKQAAFTTLRDVLSTVAKLLAPFTPHLAEELHTGIALVDPTVSIKSSVHLTEWPLPESVGERVLDLERHQELLREIVTSGHYLRQNQNLRVRQPLREIKAYSAVPEMRDVEKVEQEFGIVAEELNVKRVTFVDNESDLVTFTAKPNLKILGPRLGSKLKAVSDAIKNMTSSELVAIRSGKSIQVAGEDVSASDLLIECVAAPDWVARADGNWIVALDTRLDTELESEGFVRELVNRLQNARKNADFHVTDRIRVKMWGADGALAPMNNPELRNYLERETLCVDLKIAEEQGDLTEQEVLGKRVAWNVEKVSVTKG